MANGANRIFGIINSTSEGNNPNTSKLITLTVKSLNPFVFIRDDKLEIGEEFCYFDYFIDKNLLQVNDIVRAIVLDNGQQYYIMNNINTNINESTIYNINEKIQDSGWIDLPLAEGITVGEARKVAQYRKIGKIVYLQGDIAGVTGNGTLIGTLPIGFRPEITQYMLQPRSGTAYWRMRIDPDGSIYHQYASDGTYNSSWSEIGCSFIAH